jgi:predicted unusual protein kinase regulating ubiquinone biosynthesis (AarF/ABC1/UbiB family)
LDFGIIYKLDNQYKETFFDVSTELFTLTPESISEKFFASGIIEPVEILQQLPKHQYDHIINIGSEVMHNAIHTSKGANQVQVYKFLKEFTNFLKEPEIANLGLRPSERFVKTQLILAMAHGITLTLCKDDCITIVDKVINEIFHCDLLEDDEE